MAISHASTEYTDWLCLGLDIWQYLNRCWASAHVCHRLAGKVIFCWPLWRVPHIACKTIYSRNLWCGCSIVRSGSLYENAASPTFARSRCVILNIHDPQWSFFRPSGLCNVLAKSSAVGYLIMSGKVSIVLDEFWGCGEKIVPIWKSWKSACETHLDIELVVS